MNDITPPKKSLSDTVAEADQAPVAQPNVMPVKRRWPKVLAGILALLLVVGTYVGWQTWNNRNYPPKGTYAIVGSQSESQKNFDEIKSAYIKFDQASSAGNDVDEKKTERRAADEVILRLALQDEAQKRSKLDCSIAKVDELLKDTYLDSGGKDPYYNNLKEQYGWTQQVTLHQQCLEYYKELLQDDLIAGHDLFGVYVRWDVALDQSDEIKQVVERKASEKLNTTFVPLFEKNASNEEIEQQADINSDTSTEDFDAKTIDLENPPSRVIRLARFNNEIYKTFQQYSEGEDETEYVNQLEEGAYTKVFKSKTGYYVIYRSNKKFNGSYDSYDALLAKALETAKVSKTYQSLPEPDKVVPKPQETGQGLSFVSSLLNRALRLVVPAANAATPNSITCYGNSHRLPFTVEYRDVDTKALIRGNSGRIRMTSTGDIKTPCKDEPASGPNGYGVNISYGGINNGQITYDTSFHPNPWSFGLTCYTSWRFSFGAPTGYDELTNYKDKNRFYLKVDYASSSYAGYTASSVDGQYQIPQQYYAGIANGAKGFTIRVYFKKKPAVGNIRVESLVQTSPGGAFAKGVPAGITSNAFLCTSVKGSVPPNTLNCPNIVASEYGGTRSNTAVGVYEAAHVPVALPWQFVRAEIIYSDQCEAHKKNSPEVFATSRVAARVCADQLVTVKFYFTNQAKQAEFGPWLQTRGGNVLALGEEGISTQVKTRTGGAGARSEADYVVMAFVSTNFCSANKYNLGLTTNDTSCFYSAGYEPEHNFSQASDPVLAAVNKILEPGSSAADVNSCNSRKPYFVLSDMTTRFQNSSGFGATANCPVIGKVDSDTYAATHFFRQGRATIVNRPPSGTLTISANNTLEYTGPYGSINEIPNVGLIVEGDIVIAPNVTQLDMSIYATGKIKTCSVYPSDACNKQLRVRGMLAAGRGFELGRNVKDGNPAELIIGSGLVDAYPPPGFVDLYSENVRGVRYLTTNGNPRF